MIASVPNIRNLGILYRLLVRGRWEYEESGLLDRGNLLLRTISILRARAKIGLRKLAYNMDWFGMFTKAAGF